MKVSGRTGFLIILLLLAVTVSVSAQKPRKLVKKAEKAYYNDNLPESVALYEQAAALQPDNPKIQYRLGLLYLEQNLPEKAITVLEKAVKVTKKFNPEYNYSLAQTYQLVANFDAAIAQYQAILEKTDPEEDEEEVMLLKKRIFEVESGKLLRARRPNSSVRNPGSPLNSPADDMVPLLINNDNGMIFMSDRKGPNTKIQNEDIYEITKTEDGWANPKAFAKPLNTANPDAVAFVTPDAKTFYIFLEKNGGDIAEVKRTGPDTWSKPVILDDPINSSSFEPSFFITADGQFAFFSSDRPDGFGGLDLYLAMRQPDGSWSEAMNLGININTPYDEDAPFITEDGSTLYFSSRGHNSMGGYDIFRSSSLGAAWTPAENLGYPVNSPYDDIYFVHAANSMLGYFTSNRPGGLGQKDIYEATFRVSEPIDSLREEPTLARTDFEAPTPVTSGEPLKEADQKPLPAQIKVYGTITDAVTKKPLAATVLLESRQAKSPARNVQAEKTTGNYALTVNKGQSYELVVQHKGYIFVAEDFSVPAGLNRDSLRKDFALNVIKTGTKLVLKNVFFNYNTHVLAADSKEELDNLVLFLKNNPKARIEISGHTDNKGKPTYNQTLSLKRAQSVVNYLVANGISRARLVPVGFGSTRPVATINTDAGRKLNRRTEFKVLSN